MITLLFSIFMIAIFGKLFVLALKCAWGIGKLVLFFVFLPIILVGIVISGIVNLFIPVLLVVGLAYIIRALCVNNIE